MDFEWWHYVLFCGYGLICYIGGICAYRIDAKRVARWELHDAYEEGWRARDHDLSDLPYPPPDNNPYTL